MEKGTKENGRRVNLMEKESKHCLMEQSLMESGVRADQTGQECASILMVLNTKALGFRGNPMDKD